MMENRLKKLQNEEQRLQKQIKIAQKHSEFADQVAARRQQDKQNEEMRKYNLQMIENKQRELNNARKNSMKSNILSHQNHILVNNATSREVLKKQKQDISAAKFEAAYQDAQQKQYNALNAYQDRKAKRQSENFRREQYNLSVSQAHQRQAVENARQREHNENRIRQLEEIEQRMVSDLQRTLMSKNQAINELTQKSKSLKKVMQPRLAYKYAPKNGDGQNSQNILSAYNSTNQRRNNELESLGAKTDGPRRKGSLTQGIAPASGTSVVKSGKASPNSKNQEDNQIIIHNNNVQKIRYDDAQKWEGTITRDAGQNREEFTISRLQFNEDGKVTGTGGDTLGAFHIEGTVSGQTIKYQQQYTSNGNVAHYEGKLNEEMTEMSGEWGMNAGDKDGKFELRKC